MAGSNKPNPKRLNPEQEARLAWLREYVGVLDKKGRSGTVFHEELAKLESASGEPPEQKGDVTDATP